MTLARTSMDTILKSLVVRIKDQHVVEYACAGLKFLHQRMLDVSPSFRDYCWPLSFVERGLTRGVGNVTDAAKFEVNLFYRRQYFRQGIVGKFRFSHALCTFFYQLYVLPCSASHQILDLNRHLDRELFPRLLKKFEEIVSKDSFCGIMYDHVVLTYLTVIEWACFLVHGLESSIKTLHKNDEFDVTLSEYAVDIEKSLQKIGCTPVSIQTSCDFSIIPRLLKSALTCYFCRSDLNDESLRQRLECVETVSLTLEFLACKSEEEERIFIKEHVENDCADVDDGNNNDDGNDGASQIPSRQKRARDEEEDEDE